MNLLRFWFRNARPHALPQSLTPALLAIVLAAKLPGFDLALALLACTGVAAAHLAANLWDDFFDFRFKHPSLRDTLLHQGFRARILKCHYLTSGQASPNQLLAAAIAASLLAALCAAPIFLVRGTPILAAAVATALLAFFYSAPPFRLSYYGLGELVIAILFGPLLISGVIFAAAGHLPLSSLFLSCPTGLLVMNIVFTHAILDAVPDRAVGKRTLATLLGRRLSLALLAAILVTPFAAILAAVLTGRLHPLFLIVFAAAPLAFALFRMTCAFFTHPHQHFLPQPWMGPFPHFHRFQELGIDWFMIRWLLARNLLTAFAALLALASLLT
jgi:1,4-dihydroxy-2-naphthoate octaprenyltransferase